MSIVSARPIVEQIADAIYERLRLLTAGASDYITASEVIRFNRKQEYTPKHLQIVLAQGDPVRVRELDFPGNPPAEARQQPFNIRLHVIPSEFDETPTDTLVNVFEAEVRKVLTTPQATWHLWGNLAIDSQFGDPETITDDGSGIDGINLILLVTYRTAENDPYTVR